MDKMGNQPKRHIYFNPIQSHKRWQTQIVPLLQELKSNECDTNRIIDIMLTFNQKYCFKRKMFRQYKPKRKNDYQALKMLYEQKLPSLCKLFSTALLQHKAEDIPMVMGGKSAKYEYKKQDFVYLLLLMFFSLVPSQYSDEKESLIGKFNNTNNFSYVFSNNLFKTQCIVQYLQLSTKQLLEQQKKNEILTIIRNVVHNKQVEEIIIKNQERIMEKMTLQSNDTSLQDYNGEIKIDFANRFIGGGCLTDGCVQQEIMFAVHPQLYATTLLCQKMEDNESLAFIGFKRYFNHKGYGHTTEFDGNAHIQYEINEDQHKGHYHIKQYIAAIDAIKFKSGGWQQYERRWIDRQIMKAYIGFSALPVDGRIVTGGWGCGVYNGDIQAKLLIQWIATTLANRSMVFCPFGKKKCLEEHNLLQSLKNKSVRYVYKLLLNACEAKSQSKSGKQTIYTLALDVHSKL